MEPKLSQKSFDLNPFEYDWDFAPDDATLKLFHADERCRRAQRDLIVKNIEIERDRRYNLCDRAGLRTGKRELRRLFRAADRTVKEHRASIYRFNEKIKESLKVQNLVECEKKNTESEIKKYSEIKENMEKYVKQYSELFTLYLEKVAQTCPEFNSVQEVLNQYEILQNCKQECAGMLKKEMDEASELKRRLTKLVEEKASRMKRLDNTLVQLETRRTRAAEVRQCWNQVVTKLQDTIAEKTEQSVAFQDACYDLYNEMREKRFEKLTIRKEDTRDQLSYAEKAILYYKDVTRIATALHERQQQDTKVEETVSASDFIKHVVKEIEASRKLSQPQTTMTKQQSMLSRKLKNLKY